MRGSLLWRLMYLFCAMAGILAGYGIFALTDSKEDNFNNSTKDNTLVREAGDSVFFDDGTEGEVPSVLTNTPAPTAVPSPAGTPTGTPVPSPTATLTPTPVPAPTGIPVPTPAEVISAAVTLPPAEEVLPVAPDPTETPAITPVRSADVLADEPLPTEISESSAEEVFTYPAKIFGQVPVINRSDAYVSYFEFSYDLIAMLEPVVSARGMNMNSLLTKFVVKALFCGVDIEKLDINAPIPRRLAALCLWLAAQVLNESGCNTSAGSAAGYVTDISGCSASERKAIAYLYESGIIPGYQVQGQQFCPEEGLKTDAGNNWLAAVKQRWK